MKIWSRCKDCNKEVLLTTKPYRGHATLCESCCDRAAKTVSALLATQYEERP